MFSFLPLCYSCLHGSNYSQIAQLAELRTVNPLVVGSSPTLGAMNIIQPNNNDYCLDCKVDTLLIGEYYMVHDHVWFQTGLSKTDGMLCVGCLENRIKRLLSKKDFTNYPINTSYGFYRSKRLKSRILNEQTLLSF